MQTFTFANGQQLVSSAFTPNDFDVLAQSIVAQILGFDPTKPNTDEADQAFYKVRVGWQQEGQPAWKICEDVCILRAVLENEPFAKTRDEMYDDLGSPSEFSRHMGYTQVWRLFLAFYGPNCEPHARLVLSAMVLDWVRELFAANAIYVVPDWEPPVYAPELFAGQWWPRTDLEFRFNELAEESITVPSAAGVDGTVIKENGLTAEFHIGISSGTTAGTSGSAGTGTNGTGGTSGTVPHIVSIFAPSPGRYNDGDSLNFTVRFDQPVVVHADEDDFLPFLALTFQEDQNYFISALCVGPFDDALSTAPSTDLSFVHVISAQERSAVGTVQWGIPVAIKAFILNDGGFRIEAILAGFQPVLSVMVDPQQPDNPALSFELLSADGHDLYWIHLVTVGGDNQTTNQDLADYINYDPTLSNVMAAVVTEPSSLVRSFSGRLSLGEDQISGFGIYMHGRVTIKAGDVDASLTFPDIPDVSGISVNSD